MARVLDRPEQRGLERMRRILFVQLFQAEEKQRFCPGSREVTLASSCTIGLAAALVALEVEARVAIPSFTFRPPHWLSATLKLVGLAQNFGGLGCKERERRSPAEVADRPKPKLVVTLTFSAGLIRGIQEGVTCLEESSYSGRIGVALPTWRILFAVGA